MDVVQSVTGIIRPFRRDLICVRARVDLPAQNRAASSARTRFPLALFAQVNTSR